MRGIPIYQRKYFPEVLEDSGTSNSKPASTPLDPAMKLGGDDNPPFEDVGAYRRLDSRLIYPTTTRIDIDHVTQ